MNSYSLGISGSWWLFSLLLILSFAISYYAYRYTVPQVSDAKRRLLMGLRTLGIALLLFVLFEPIYTKISGTKEPARLAVILDNSVSSGLTDALGDRKVQFKNAIQNSNFQSLDNDLYKVTLFSSETAVIRNYNDSVLKFDGQLTDISKGLNSVSDYAEKENIQAVLLITDGAFNSGLNPIYSATALGKPVFTIGIGDSTEPKDVNLQSIITNDVAFIDNPIPVNVNFKVSGFKEGDLKLTLLDNGSQIGEQTFKVNPEKQAITAVFEFKPKTDGIHKITARISSLSNEITEKNNTISEFVNVLKNKRRIAIFAGAPSPDVSFITNALQADKSVEVKSYIQKKGAEFYDPQPNQQELNNTEVIFFVGFPIQSTPSNVMEMIKKELSVGKPIFFLASQYTDYEKLRAIEEFLPFITTVSRPNEFYATPDIKAEGLSNPLMRVNGNDEDMALWNQLPPLFRTETFVKVKPETEVISTMKINNVPLKEPLIMSRAIQNKKSVAVLGYGLYRWKLLGYGEETAKGQTDRPDLFTAFINNSFKWLSINQNNKLVNIKTTKKVYSKFEKVEFNAQVYDASYSPIDNAVVSVKVNTGTAQRDIVLGGLGNGRYTATIDGLAEGDYFFTGSATFNGRSLGNDKGRFSVGDVSIEYQNLTMQSGLLRSISERTGGKFFLPENSKEFLNYLNNLKNFKPRGITLRSEYNLRNIAWILGLVIICFGAEWFIRKKSGML